MESIAQPAGSDVRPLLHRPSRRILAALVLPLVLVGSLLARGFGPF